MKFEDRIADQEEIGDFLEKIFPGQKKVMGFEEYKELNTNVSCELFYSIMAIFHEKLPCSQNFFRLKRLYRSKYQGGSNGSGGSSGNNSPCRVVASPTIYKKSLFQVASKFKSQTEVEINKNLVSFSPPIKAENKNSPTKASSVYINRLSTNS